MKILLYSPDNGVTRNFKFLLQSLTPAGHEVLQGIRKKKPVLALRSSILLLFPAQFPCNGGDASRGDGPNFGPKLNKLHCLVSLRMPQLRGNLSCEMSFGRSHCQPVWYRTVG